MQKRKLKYIGYTITMQEVPDEISLVISISGCTNRCSGCHSKYLHEYVGKYLSDDIETIINQYKNLFTCVCFMGGDQNIDELFKINIYCQSKGYKTCLYSGKDDENILNFYCFDYVKIGSYKKKYGGLNVQTTNQKMFKLCDGKYKDITHWFQNNRG